MSKPIEILMCCEPGCHEWVDLEWSFVRCKGHAKAFLYGQSLMATALVKRRMV